MKSILTKNQTKSFGPVTINLNGDEIRVRATVRYDDRCNNGHNTFSITGESKLAWDRWDNGSAGCIHDEIAAAFPELASFIKWHLVSSDGPMHYIANTLYHAKVANLECAQASAVWPQATLDQLGDRQALLNRLPALLEAFKADVESLGFVY